MSSLYFGCIFVSKSLRARARSHIATAENSYKLKHRPLKKYVFVVYIILQNKSIEQLCRDTEEHCP